MRQWWLSDGGSVECVAMGGDHHTFMEVIVRVVPVIFVMALCSVTIAARLLNELIHLVRTHSAEQVEGTFHRAERRILRVPDSRRSRVEAVALQVLVKDNPQERIELALLLRRPAP